jgi:hypothetical protein
VPLNLLCHQLRKNIPPAIVRANEVSETKVERLLAEIAPKDSGIRDGGKTSSRRIGLRAHDTANNIPSTATMPPMNTFSAMRTLPLRQKPTAAFRASFQRPAWRAMSDSASQNTPGKLPKAEGEDAVGPNMQQQEHVSEEAAKMAKITGGEGPDIEGQGTPVQEVRLHARSAYEELR